MTLDAEFSRLFATVDYPVYVVTATDGRERAGCLVGFATQCSIHPPRFLVCLSKRNHTYRVALRADVLAVHLLASDQQGLARLFGGETGDDMDKFTRVEWRAGPGDVPVLVDCAHWFAGQVLGRADLGDHEAFWLQPLAVGAAGDGPWLMFQEVQKVDPGHDP